MRHWLRWRGRDRADRAGGLSVEEPHALVQSKARRAIAIEIDERMGALLWLAKAREAITRAQRLGAKLTLRDRQAR